MPIAPSSRLCIMGYLALLYTTLFVYFFGAIAGIEPAPLSAYLPTLTTTDSVLPLYDTALPCYALSVLHFAATTAPNRRCLCPTSDTYLPTPLFVSHKRHSTQLRLYCCR